MTNKQPKCTDCYDKGFSTEYKGAVIAHADFIGDRDRIIDEAKVVINYCRGKKGRGMENRALKKYAETKILRKN